jgi:hypothetical protein
MAYIMQLRRRRERVYHPRLNLFEEYDDIELLRRYRFNRAGIEYLEGLFAAHLRRQTERNHALQPLEQLCLALRFYAAGPHQRVSRNGVSLFRVRAMFFLYRKSTLATLTPYVNIGHLQITGSVI